MAKKSVASGPKESHYVVPFRTRCAPKQLMEVCRILKRDEDKMRRLKAIGLDKLVNISCPQINRDLCGVHVLSWLQMWDGSKQAQVLNG